MATPQAVYKLYKSVIDDVVNNVREAFIDEGVDEQVLQDLKQIWENKLLQTEAVDPNAPEPPSQAQSHKSSSDQRSNESVKNSSRPQNEPDRGPPAKVPLYDKKFQPAPTQPTQFSGTLSSPATAATLALQQQVLQISQGGATTLTLPQGGQTFQVQGMQGNVGYQVPVVIQHLAQGNQQLGARLMTSIPQQGAQQSNRPSTIPMTLAQARQPRQDGAQKILQLDGTNDTSDEEESDDAEENNEEDDDDDDQDENDLDEYSNAVEEEPLNSDDDVSDEDPQELFEAENVVVCQYDKISRTRNKWKFQLKQGIMNLKGRDNVFFKAMGEADW